MPAAEMKVKIFNGVGEDVEHQVNEWLAAGPPIGYGIAQTMIHQDSGSGKTQFVFMLGILRPNHVTPNGIERRIN